MDIDNIRAKILETTNPDSSYSIDDFNSEFLFSASTSSTLVFSQPKYELNFVNKSDNPNPEYATNGSSGFDLRANLADGVITGTIIPSGEVRVIPTGLYFDIPENYEIQIRPRSGLAAKHSVTVLNTPGTIDSDYTGEIKVILINHGKEDFTILHGDRIAQGVLVSVLGNNFVRLNNVSVLNKTSERGSGGFGSTGLA